MGSQSPQTSMERANLSSVCRHLALVAVDGATDEVVLTLDPAFRLHLDGLETNRWGYLALIEANHAAAHPGRPPLEVLDADASGAFVSVYLDPHCAIHVQVIADVIAEMGIDGEWRAGPATP